MKLNILLFCLLLPFHACLLAQENSNWSYSFNLEAAGKYTEAAKVLEGFLENDADREFAEMRSGWLYYLAGDFNRSTKHYQNALKINGQSLEAKLGLTLPLIGQQRWREAAQLANEVIAESKWNYYAHVRLMICEEALGLWGDLIKHANQVQRKYPADGTILVYLARGYANNGEQQQAKNAYQQVLHRIPGHVEAMQYLGR